MRAPFALADKESGPQPQRANFGPLKDYYTAWHHWRAMRRDAYPTNAELDAMHAALAAHLGITLDH